ncbi:tetratricopeptide repeat protein [Dactylosporangium sp. NPDC051541]|uniref:tetratricopeptide repeat protein n=1 Tax=Dactylosporangium sp. NPDC051541 TaxID=3363977 RepID=UPI0037BBF8EF
MDSFVGRSDEQDRFRQVLAEVSGKSDDGPDEGYVVLVQGYGGIGKSMLLDRFVEIARREKHTVFKVDWMTDSKLHRDEYAGFAGPPVWRILERIRAALEEEARGWGWRRRRRLRRFAEFQRQVVRLPELEQRAAELGIGRQVGHRPVSPEQLAKAAGEFAQSAGAAAAVAAPIGAVFTAVASFGSTLLQTRRARIDPALYRALFDEVNAVVTAFVEGVRALARPRPVVIVLDTCELLGESGPWLRKVMQLCGRRVVWVVGSRLPELLAEPDDFTREMREQRLRMLKLIRFDDRTAIDYLRLRLGALPPELDTGRVIGLTQGIPLALNVIAELIADRQQAGLPFDDLYQEVWPDGTVSSVVYRMAERYLVHAVRDKHSDLRQDLPLLYGLALVDIDRNGLDPGLLGAAWDIDPDQVRDRLQELRPRHGFFHSGDGTLHRDIRKAIQYFLVDSLGRASEVVRQINERVVEHLRERLGAFEHDDVEAQLRDSGWRAANAALLWHTFWLDTADGVRMLRRILPAAAILHRSYAQVLVDNAVFFRPHCTPEQKDLINGFELVVAAPAPSGLGDAADATLFAEDGSPYVHLLYAQEWSVFDLGLPERVRHLRLATQSIKPASGSLADRIGEVARALPSTDPGPLTAADRKVLIDGLRIAARYTRTAEAFNNLGSALYNLGRVGAAGTAYRQALRCDPDYALAHNGLGATLHSRDLFEAAETAYQEALRRDPDYALAHNNLGCALFAQGKYEQAEAAHREALRLDPGNAIAHNDLGSALYSRHEFTAAQEAYQEALRLDPGNAIARNNLGTALYRQGRTGEAKAAYEQALRCDPDNAVARDNLRIVELSQARPTASPAGW